MNSVHQEKNEEYFEDLMGVAAFGHLTEEEQSDFDAYLARSASARAEFAELLAVVDVLPLALDEIAPSAGLRVRLAAAVGADVQTPPTTQASAAPTLDEVPKAPSNISWFASRAGKALSAAAAVIVIAVAAITLNMTLNDTESQNIDIAAIPAGITGSLEYQPDDEKFVFESEGMPAAPDGQVYQVWLIPAEGNPVSVGLMEGGEFEVEANRDDYGTFAITVEPGPTGSAGPTTAPIVVAPLH